MAYLCGRCKQNNLGMCKKKNVKTFKITDEMIKNQNYECFEERIYRVSYECGCDDLQDFLYGNEITDKEKAQILNYLNGIRQMQSKRGRVNK